MASVEKPFASKELHETNSDDLSSFCITPHFDPQIVDFLEPKNLHLFLKSYYNHDLLLLLNYQNPPFLSPRSISVLYKQMNPSSFVAETDQDNKETIEKLSKLTMISESIVPVLLLLLLLVLVPGSVFMAADALSPLYYVSSCPVADMAVRNTVTQALHKDPTLAGPLLRLHFHDCFVEGCDGSVLIDSTAENTAEKDSPANLSLRGFNVIDQAKEELENQCPGVVSCADIVAMAARDAVFMAGGPFYEVAKGRKDGRTSRIEDTTRLPSPNSNLTSLLNIFGQHGFSVHDLVALSGAHTLGVARCTSFKSRLSGFDSTHDVDPSLDAAFARSLTRQCSGGAASEVWLDATRNSFDVAYFRALQRGDGVLASDQTLYTSATTGGLVDVYVANPAMFFLDFTAAMAKMGSLDVKEGAHGEVRVNCHRVNE